MNSLKAEGYREEFIFEDHVLHTKDRSMSFQADDLMIDRVYRFEGTVDPSDMSVLYAITASDGTKGIISDGYGVYMDQDFASFIKKAPQKRAG